MKKNRFTAFFIFIVLSFSIIPLYAEDKKENHTPEPYGVDEFTTWQKELRRFEIISFGAMPFVSLLTFWSYDIIRSIKHKGDPAYNPWPVKKPEIAKPLTEDEQKKIFGAIVGISIGVALIDFSYRAIKRAVNRKKIKAIKAGEEDVIKLIPLDEAALSEEEGSIEEKNLFIPIKDGASE